MPNPTKLVGSTRLLLGILSFFGCAVMYSMRVNLSVAIVCMVNRTYINETKSMITNWTVDECGHSLDNQAALPSVTGEFLWDKHVQGSVLGAFFWGYLFTQILGGWSAQRFGAHKIILVNVVVSILATLFSPFAARLHYTALMGFRVLMGLVQGSMFPGFIVLWTRWAPPDERSKLTSFTFAGMQIGYVIALPLASFLCQYGFAGGWPSIFYTFGIASVAWTVAWFFLASDTPLNHKFISGHEKAYITKSLGESLEKPLSEGLTQIPWLSIFKSAPVWACFAAHFAGDWGGYLMLTCLPLFLNEVLHFDMSNLGFVASFPYLASWAGITAGGILADYLIKKRWMTVLNVRRSITGLAMASQAVCLVAAGYCQCGQEILAVALLTISAGLASFQCAGFTVNYMEIAPRYSGIIVGIGNSLSCVGGILAPAVMSALTSHHTRAEWLTLFYVTAAILFAGAAIYCVFAKSDVQPWAQEIRKEEAEKLNAT